MDRSGKPRNRARILWITAVAIAVGALALGRILSSPEGAPEGSAGAGRQGGEARGGGGKEGSGKGGGRALEVSYQVARPETLSRTLNSSGTVLAREEVDLRSETSGRVTAVHLKEGAPTRKGALLVKINDAELRAELRKLGHQVKLAEEREVRQKALLERQAVSREEYDIALQSLNSLLSERDLLNARLEKTEVRAPFDGVVGLKAVSEGSFVSPGDRIAGFFSLHPLKIDFSIPERYFSRVKAGDPVRIGVEGLEAPVDGTIYAVEPKVDPATRMLRIRAHCPNEDGRIPPGASARIEIPLKSSGGVIMAPSMAVLPDIRGQKVMILKGGKALSVPVGVGYRTEDRVEVTGLSPGDTLITSGLVRIRDGMAVKAAAARGP